MKRPWDDHASDAMLYAAPLMPTSLEAGIKAANARYEALKAALTSGDRAPYVALCVAQRLAGVLTAADCAQQIGLFDKLRGKLFREVSP